MNWDKRGILSELSFTDRKSIRYLDQAWLRKATDIVRGRRGSVTELRRDLQQQVSSLVLAMVSQPPPYLLYCTACPTGKSWEGGW